MAAAIHGHPGWRLHPAEVVIALHAEREAKLVISFRWMKEMSATQCRSRCRIRDLARQRRAATDALFAKIKGHYPSGGPPISRSMFAGICLDYPPGTPMARPAAAANAMLMAQGPEAALAAHEVGCPVREYLREVQVDVVLGDRTMIDDVVFAHEPRS